MEPTTAEQLSRYLDGDLDAAAAELLEGRLASEPELARELEALRRIRRQVAQVAERMVPPEDLDAVLLPLAERAPGPVRRLPPAVRWLGMAAGVALAVTVAVEVARKPPERGLTSAPPPGPPAPFSSPTELERSEAEPAGALGDADAPPRPEPADRAAPQQADPRSTEAQRRGKDTKGGRPPAGVESSAAAANELKRQAGEAANEGPEAAAKVAAPLAAAAPRAELRDQAELSGELPAAAEADGATVGPARLVLYDAGGGSIAALELPPGGASPAAAPLVVTVADGAIRAIESADGGDVPALKQLVGRALPDLPDGRYRAGVEAAIGSP